MSEFFEPKDGESAAEAMERGMRREERRYAQNRQVITTVLALSVVGAVLLGGGLAAVAIAHRPAPGAASSVAAITPRSENVRRAVKTKRFASTIAPAGRAHRSALARAIK